jgi:hypothetical protein
MDETSDWEPCLPEPPDGFRWQAQPKHGFAIALPRSFHLLANTADLVARTWRHIEGRDEPDYPFGEGPWPTGFFDLLAVGVLEGDRPQPFRLLEFDVIGGRREPLSDEERGQMWLGFRRVLPSLLEDARLSGYRLLDVREGRLGALDALAFDYRWDGLREFEGGGDHALVLWAPAPRIVYQVYHHCPESRWEACLPELEEILASFTVLETE